MTVTKNTIRQLNALRRWREIQQLQSSATLMRATVEKSRSEQALSQANATLLLLQQQQRLQRLAGRELDLSRYENHLLHGEFAAEAVNEKRQQLTASETRVQESRKALGQAQINLDISTTILDRKRDELATQIQKHDFSDVMDKQLSARGQKR